MAFALQSDEQLARGVRRLILEQLDNAVSHLSALEADPIEAIHETRKSIKRTRTMLRLLRKLLGKTRFEEENSALQAVAERLSLARDTHMLVEATERLVKHVGPSPFAEAATPVLAALRERAWTYPITEEVLHESVAALQRARQRIEDFCGHLTSRPVADSIGRGVRRMLGRGMRAYDQAYTQPSDDNFHAWRKRIKDLYYAASLLHLTRPNKLAPYIDALDRAAEDLGDEHDLGVLARVLHDAPQEAGGAVPVALLLQLIGRRREELRSELRSLGKKIYKRGKKRTVRFLCRGLKA